MQDTQMSPEEWETNELKDYYKSFNPDLLVIIPPNAKTILEAGCGAGSLAKEFKKINPTCKWYGMENNEKALQEAKKVLDGYCDQDIEDDLYFHLGDEWPDRFDCLIFGDLLEHLKDPWAVLKNFTDLYLKEGGICLASIPNIGNFNVILSLLSGNWDYTDEGLLDKTHLRFFTLKSIKEMFASADLTILNINPRILGSDYHKDFIEMFGAAAQKLGVSQDDFDLQSKAWQYVVTAIKGPKPTEKMLLRAFPAELCCALPRLRDPGKMLVTIPGVRYSEMPTTVAEDESVVIVRQRFNWNLDEVRSHVANGFIVIGEWDDAPEWFFALPEGDPRRASDLMFRGCHAIQCATEFLAGSIREIVGEDMEIRVFPNQLTKISPPREYAASNDGRVRIFFGAQNRQNDWRPIMPSINRVIAGRKDIEFIVIHDREFYDALEIPASHKKFYPGFLPYEKYREVLRKCDIALLPLEDTEFNRCKSDIKFLECAAEGVMVIASDIVYYETVMEVQTKYGWILDSYGNSEEFEMFFRERIDDPQSRIAVALDAYDYVRDHRMLYQHYPARHEWYKSLVARKDELNESLRQRVPELFTDSSHSE